MQGAIVHQNWIREMALQYLSTPGFPFMQILNQGRNLLLLTRVAAQQFGCTGRGTCTRIQQRDIRFTPRECLVNDRNIPNDESEKPKTCSRFQCYEESSNTS